MTAICDGFPAGAAAIRFGDELAESFGGDSTGDSAPRDDPVHPGLFYATWITAKAGAHSPAVCVR